jgi:hypothetical protein
VFRSVSDVPLAGHAQRSGTSSLRIGSVRSDTPLASAQNSAYFSSVDYQNVTQNVKISIQVTNFHQLFFSLTPDQNLHYHSALQPVSVFRVQ